MGNNDNWRRNPDEDADERYKQKIQELEANSVRVPELWLAADGVYNSEIGYVSDIGSPQSTTRTTNSTSTDTSNDSGGRYDGWSSAPTTNQQRFMDNGFDYVLDMAGKGNTAALESGLNNGWLVRNDDYWESSVGDDGTVTWTFKGPEDADQYDAQYWGLADDSWGSFYGDVYIDDDQAFRGLWVDWYGNNSEYAPYLEQYGGAEGLYDAISSGEVNLYRDDSGYTENFYGLDDVSRQIVEASYVLDAIENGSLTSNDSDPYVKQAVRDWSNYNTVVQNYQNGTATAEQVQQAWDVCFGSAMDLSNQIIGGLYIDMYDNGDYETVESLEPIFNTILYSFDQVDNPEYLWDSGIVSAEDMTTYMGRDGSNQYGEEWFTPQYDSYAMLTDAGTASFSPADPYTILMNTQNNQQEDMTWTWPSRDEVAERNLDRYLSGYRFGQTVNTAIPEIQVSNAYQLPRYDSSIYSRRNWYQY